MCDENLQNHDSESMRKKARHDIWVKVVASISLFLLGATLCYLGFHWDALTDKCVQRNTRLLFCIWTLIPPLLFWVEYQWLWKAYNDTSKEPEFERFKYAQDLSSKIWLAMVTILAAFCWAGLDSGNKKSGESATSKHTQAIQKVLEQLQALDKETQAAAIGGHIDGAKLTETALKMKHINIHDCPSDFQEAWIRMAGAIGQSGLVLKKYPDKLTLALNMGLKLLSGQNDAGLEAMLEELRHSEKELLLWDTELKALAVRHGAKLLHD